MYTVQVLHRLKVTSIEGIEVGSNPTQQLLIRVVLDATIVKVGKGHSVYRRWFAVERCELIYKFLIDMKGPKPFLYPSTSKPTRTSIPNS